MRKKDHSAASFSHSVPLVQLSWRLHLLGALSFLERTFFAHELSLSQSLKFLTLSFSALCFRSLGSLTCENLFRVLVRHQEYESEMERQPSGLPSTSLLSHRTGEISESSVLSGNKPAIRGCSHHVRKGQTHFLTLSRSLSLLLRARSFPLPYFCSSWNRTKSCRHIWFLYRTQNRNKNKKRVSCTRTPPMRWYELLLLPAADLSHFARMRLFCLDVPTCVCV